jgi:hypothetical protein
MVRDNRDIRRGGWVFIKTSALDKDRSRWPGINDRKTCRYEAEHDPGFPAGANLGLIPDDEAAGAVAWGNCVWFDPRYCSAVVSNGDGCNQCIIA